MDQGERAAHRLPTVTDVAAYAGVSRQTVSNVMNTPGVVREETRLRVQSAIDALGYRPHASARRLRTQLSSTIAVRLDPETDGISGSLLDRFLHQLTEQADRRGLRVLLYTATDADDEIRQFARLLDGADVDAFVLTSTGYDDPRISWLVARGTRFVTFGRPWGVDDMTDPTHRWVDVDGRHGLQVATRHLLEQGSSRVAFLGWPRGSGTGDDRRAGWRDAMSASGLSPSDLDGLDIAVTDGVAEGSVAARLLQERGTRFDAIVCASDSLALGARLALPAAMPVVGYDDTPIARALGFPSVHQPLDEVATGVLDLLERAPRPAGDTTGEDAADAVGADPKHRLVRPRLALR